MDFRISDTFTESLSRLTGDEQKAVKITVFDLQLNPANPGMSFHKLDKAKDKNFWSVRVNSDIRLIVHRSSSCLLLCYVGHHDDAYSWAERRKLETHPKTGAAQLVEIRETIREIQIPKYIHTSAPSNYLFADITENELLRYGVPDEWIGTVKTATEETFLGIADHLPQEAAEAILELATGSKPSFPTVTSTIQTSPFDHPDAKRRFRTIENIEELERAFESPWEKWSVFLHPQQQDLIERDFKGPFRVSGSAGTGKTIVALHRAVHLAKKYPDSRVLLTTFSEPLANALRNKLKVLLKHSPRIGERLEVYAINDLGRRLYKFNLGECNLANENRIKEALAAAQKSTDESVSLQFLYSEWTQIVDAWQLQSWEEYRHVARLGRKTRLPEKQRQAFWGIFEKTRKILSTTNLLTHAELFTRLSVELSKKKNLPFDFAVVDECQDMTIPQLRFLSSLAGARDNGLFFAGDLGQRIFQQPFSWKSVGVDIRGRSRTLKVNYRTSHQIRKQADRLLGPILSDVDGNQEERNSTISIFNGPQPQVEVFSDTAEEIHYVADWISERQKDGILSHEIALFVRSDSQLSRAKNAALKANVAFKVLDEVVETTQDNVAIATMHLAKGLEFRAVAVMACDDEVIPSQERIESVGDDADLKEIYNTERHLLYVACTRARDYLLVTGVEPVSEFLDDLGVFGYGIQSGIASTNTI